MNIAIYIYDEAEVLDFSGPFEVLSTAKRLADNDWRVFFVAQHDTLVSARGGYGVNPHYCFQNHPPIDVLIVVGGVHTAELNKPEVVDWIRAVARDASEVASVCTGAFLLAKAGVVTDQSVTTHWEDIADLKAMFPALDVQAQVRWVRSGNITTSAGISAGIDMSLYLVSVLDSMALAERTANQMEYDWNKTQQ
ncbi:DJ-1/PfpI family protein [Vibrio furnissii]|uniref:Glutamine amidotransferase n=1 Tax=Vibrio furnissii TaxID=29494 RepID=A0A0Q2S9W7_VIBFU|nr:DJ-1/PfpI family protein [Vibrio furnissii]KQH84115.1 glutamine amidotransferase [Vibrio furnissii]MCG6268773.1 DJ-1/PfpI family protein [Vibrio furnissii]UHJ63327.1 DJ-1/PfpI family protein [Vibrio furnissii]